MARIEVYRGLVVIGDGHMMGLPANDGDDSVVGEVVVRKGRCESACRRVFLCNQISSTDALFEHDKQH